MIEFMNAKFLENYLLWDEFLMEFIIFQDKIVYFNYTDNYLKNIQCSDQIKYKVIGNFEKNITIALWDGTYDYLYTNLGVIYTGN